MSIRLALDITTSELMYNDTLILDDSIEELQLIKRKKYKRSIK